MVKLLLPLGSLAASGTLAKAITFARQRGVQYARVRVTPKNPRSGLQTGLRATFGSVARQFPQLDHLDQAAWNELAAGTRQTGRNLMIGSGQSRGRQNQPPIRSPRHGAAPLPDAAVMASLQALENAIRSLWAAGLNVPEHTWSLYRSLSTISEASPGHLIAVLPASVLSYTDVFGTRRPDTFYYAVRGGNNNGDAGQLSNVVSGTMN